MGRKRRKRGGKDREEDGREGDDSTGYKSKILHVTCKFLQFYVLAHTTYFGYGESKSADRQLISASWRPLEAIQI